MSSSRYERQILLPELGEQGQQLLREARVLLVGVGGLGSPVSLALAGAGVGTLGLVDDDVVSLTNLHRQLLYSETALGKSKVSEAAHRLRELNSEVRVNIHDGRFTRENAASLVAGYDCVVDGCDNFATRYLIDEVCARLHIPYIYGAVCGFEGQVSVFHHGEHPRSYRELYPDEAAMLSLPAAGKEIMPSTTTVVGGVMAQQTFQVLARFGNVLSGKLWVTDLRTLHSLLLDF